MLIKIDKRLIKRLNNDYQEHVKHTRNCKYCYINELLYSKDALKVIKEKIRKVR